jgi:hypothetical protein
MGTRDSRIDAYIDKAAPFARPILAHLREVVHAACPDAQETLKWRSPTFEHRGILCGMAAFKQHCVFGFWKHELVVGGDRRAQEAMGSFGRLTKLSDLPSRAALARFVKKAAKLNEDGVTVARAKRAPKSAVRMHPALKAALAKNARATGTYEGFSPSAKREYLEWIADAKADATRERRIAQAVEWMAAGKRRNWKYERC